MKDGSGPPWTVDSISGTFENFYQTCKKLEPKNDFFTQFEILVEFFSGLRPALSWRCISSI